MSTPAPSLEETQRYPWRPRERYEAERTRRAIVGAPATVAQRMVRLVADHAADEVMIVMIAPDYASRQRSYERIVRWRVGGC
jgi:alkanesulfonate monooxygenase SsuD/methylene tetrahydromethanopterin reductase-like flavin-dependent oxidoreductase (luciferase family)